MPVEFADFVANIGDLLIYVLTHVRNFAPDACDLLTEMVIDGDFSVECVAECVSTPRVFLLRDEDTNSIDSGIPVSPFHALVSGCGGHHQAVMSHPLTKRIMIFSDKKKTLSTQKLGKQDSLSELHR